MRTFHNIWDASEECLTVYNIKHFHCKKERSKIAHLKKLEEGNNVQSKRK